MATKRFDSFDSANIGAANGDIAPLVSDNATNR